METALGILLLIGAFTLGAVTSDGADDDTRTAQIENENSSHYVQTVAASSLQKCKASGAKTYRDLTVPYARPDDQKQIPADDCEDGCWDE